MRVDFETELINTIAPFISEDDFMDVKMAISLVCSGYEIKKEETSIAVYQGDINDEILKRFLMAKIARGLSRRTVEYYKNSVKMSLEIIGKPYNEVTTDDIRLYLAKRVQVDKVSKTTANNERRNLSAFYTWLRNEEILLKNPMARVEAIKEEKKKKKAFTQMEIEKLRLACRSNRETAIIETLISTWARVSEISQIKLQEIDGDKIIVHGKGAKDREVYLTPRAVLAIENYLNERKDKNPYLFPRAKNAGDVKAMTKGKRRQTSCKWYMDPKAVDEERHSDSSTIESIVRKIGQRAEVEKAHPHRFRRTGATMALQSGMELITVSKLLGHENIGTTQIYLDISDEDMQAAHKKYS